MGPCTACPTSDRWSARGCAPIRLCIPSHDKGYGLKRAALIQELYLRGSINWLQMAHMVLIKCYRTSAGSAKSMCVRFSLGSILPPKELGKRTCLERWPKLRTLPWKAVLTNFQESLKKLFCTKDNLKKKKLEWWMLRVNSPKWPGVFIAFLSPWIKKKDGTTETDPWSLWHSHMQKAHP